jgi:hypothetical protein
MALSQVFGLDQRHVDVVLAFALAPLAGDAQDHGLGQLRIGQGPVGKIAVEGRLEQPHPTAGGETRVTAHPKAGTHDPLGMRFALAAIDTDRYRLGEVAAMSGDVGIGIAHAGVLLGGPIEVGLHGRVRVLVIRRP